MVINNERDIAEELFEMDTLLASNAEPHLANEFVFVVDLLFPDLDEEVVVFQRNGHHAGSSVDHGNRDILMPSRIDTRRHHFLRLNSFISKVVLARILKSHGLSLRTANVKNVLAITEFRELERPPLVIHQSEILQLAIYLVIVDPAEDHIRFLGLERRFPFITETKAHDRLADFLIIPKCQQIRGTVLMIWAQTKNTVDALI